MTATITADDANSFIKKLGFESLSSIESAAFIEQVNSKDAELDAAGYSDAKVQQENISKNSTQHHTRVNLG